MIEAQTQKGVSSFSTIDDREHPGICVALQAKYTFRTLSPRKKKP
jgi:hypothetical protein